jgi:hypothetical protein
MRVYFRNPLRLGSRCGFADEFCLFDRSDRLPHKILFVIDNRDILSRQIANLVVRNFPKFLRYLRDEAEVVRDDDYAAFVVFDGTSESINRCHVQVISGLVWRSSVIRIQALDAAEKRLTEKEDVRVFH